MRMQFSAENSVDAEEIAYMYAMKLPNLEQNPVFHWKSQGRVIPSRSQQSIKWLREKIKEFNIRDFGNGKVTDHQIIAQTEIDVFAETHDKVYCVETTHHQGGYFPTDKSDREPVDFFVQKIIRAAVCGWYFQREECVKPVQVLFMTTRFRSADDAKITEALSNVKNALQEHFESNVRVTILKGLGYVRFLEYMKSLVVNSKSAHDQLATINRHLTWVSNELRKIRRTRNYGEDTSIC